ncbi:MgtC/SapB family protein [Anaeromyxobacter oryzae]|uniref:Magnesium transporter n=1 Tax=Anaeromyxobacter oryzae TaxID=2918170 RepID=A0ABN6MWD8_9BACT|nr:MgtC/SapB family protein [Anaeromyxobacter oryzae]BDG04132.1 magnesium transporter [Anaeromyxobacter oryzae]
MGGGTRIEILAHLGAALLAGAAIGIERSWHGRPAGFRTHALVCVASSLLMLLTLYQRRWFPSVGDSVRIDPTRMAQGIMTGIGFLGAGVIFKEGLTVRGLTTAASIWITSAIGVLMGSGLYFPAFSATVITLGVLSAFRAIENRLPAAQFAHHRLRFDRGEVLPEETVRALLARHDFKVSGVSYRLVDEGRTFEYRMTIRTRDPRNFTRLAASLQALASVREFHISPAGD